MKLPRRELGRVCLDVWGHARNRPSTSCTPTTCEPGLEAHQVEEDKFWSRKKSGHHKGSGEVVDGMLHKGCPLPWLVDKCSYGAKTKQEVAYMCLLHRPQQSMLQRQLSTPKDRHHVDSTVGHQTLNFMDAFFGEQPNKDARVWPRENCFYHWPGALLTVTKSCPLGWRMQEQPTKS